MALAKRMNTKSASNWANVLSPLGFDLQVRNLEKAREMAFIISEIDSNPKILMGINNLENYTRKSLVNSSTNCFKELLGGKSSGQG